MLKIKVTFQIPSPAGGVSMEIYIHSGQAWCAQGGDHAIGCAVNVKQLRTRHRCVPWDWQHLLDEGKCRSAAEIAEIEGMDVTQIWRLLRLTLLAPELVERSIKSKDIVLDNLLRQPLPLEWLAQRQAMATLLTKPRGRSRSMHHAPNLLS